MTISTTQSPDRRWSFRRIVMGLVLAAAIGGIAAPAALAQDYRHDDRYRRDDHRHDDRGRGYGYYVAPAPVYAPPPVVYAPPPPPAALSFVFPLNFR